MSDNELSPSLGYIDIQKGAKVFGSCLKQDKITFTHKNIESITLFIK